jgi:hypothetical protein
MIAVPLFYFDGTAKIKTLFMTIITIFMQVSMAIITESGYVMFYGPDAQNGPFNQPKDGSFDRGSFLSSDFRPLIFMCIGLLRCHKGLMGLWSKYFEFFNFKI